MTPVYVVTYCDRVLGVFSTREKAFAYIAQHAKLWNNNLNHYGMWPDTLDALEPQKT